MDRVDKPVSAEETQCDTEASRRRSLAAEHELRLRRKQAESSNLKDTIERGDERQDEEAENEGPKGKREEEDDDNVVVPAWPSRGDTLQGIRAVSTETVQHQVYSLKDYSQVQPAGKPALGRAHERHHQSSSVGKLLKSMSQDQKFGPSNKRLSESLSYAMSGLNPSSNQQRSSSQQQPGSESRIDRVRKLFVSPLSLSRSNNANQTGSTGKLGSGQARLSFQSSASSVLNKPHHLMHAMYQRGLQSSSQVSASGSRRSPMRQKQAKSFRVYGCPLHMANNIYPITCFGRADIYKQQSVPYILARLCNYIEENSSQLTHEGIFRVSGNARLMEKLRTLFNHLGDAPLELESVDVATSASMLKMYLRELPEPLIPTRMNYYFITLAKKYSPLLLAPGNGLSPVDRLRAGCQATPRLRPDKSGSSTSVHTESSTQETSLPNSSSSSNQCQANNERQRVAFSRELTKLIRKLPIENYNLLKYLACFLYRVSLKQQYNKMCAEALGIVFGPNVFRIRSESYKGLKEQEFSNQIMASIISNYRSIFDSELTDPLGNLVELDTTTDKKPTVQQAACKTSNQIPLLAPAQASLETSSNASGASQAPKSSELAEKPDLLFGSPKASSSRHQGRRNETTRRTCCSKHCRAHKFSDYSTRALTKHPKRDVITNDEDNGANEEEDADEGEEEEGDEEEEEDDEEEEEDEEEVEDEDEEAESYTRSSESDSYCSSSGASESLESMYDSQEGPDGHRGRRAHSHNFDHAHRDRMDDDSDTDMGSNFSSSDCETETSYTPSSSRSIDSDTDQSGQLGAPDDESATVADDTVSKSEPDAGLVCERCDSSLDSKELLASELLNDATPDKVRAEPTIITLKPFGGSRRHRPDATGGSGTSGDRTNILPRRASSRARRQRPSRQPHRYTALLKRRSSSASSLNRIRHRRDQMMFGHRRADRQDASGYSGRRARASTRSSGRWEHRACPGDLYWLELAGVQEDQQRFDDELALVNRYDAGLFELDRRFMLRPFNSDETLLCSATSSRPSSGQQACRHPDEQTSSRHMDQVDERMQQRRRFSGVDLLSQEARRLDLVELLKSAKRDKIYEDIEAVESDRKGDLGSFVSLLDSKPGGFKRSQLSMDRLVKQEANEHPSERGHDPLMVQMRATKRLIKSLRRALKFGNSRGCSSQLIQLLQKLVNNEVSPPDYSDDCLASYADYMSAQSLAERLEELLCDINSDCSQMEGRVEPRSSESLNGLLNVKITLFKQRYNDLKSIRDHFMRSHCSWARSATKDTADSLGPMQARPDQQPLARQRELPTRSHGSLDTLRPSGEPDCAHQTSSIRDRKYSVPNRNMVAVKAGGWQESGSSALSAVNRSNSSLSVSTSKPPYEVPCKFGPLCPLEFVFNMERLLADRRAAGSRLIRLNEMDVDQLQS